MKTKLLPHQNAFIAWAKDRDIVANFAEPGTGKTVMTLAWLERHRARFILWITIPPYLRETIQEVYKHSEYRATALRTADQLSGPRRVHPGTIFVVNYERVKLLSDTLSRTPFDAVVADESTCLKRIQAQRTRVAIRCLKHVPKRTILSGKPITNSLFDIWSQYLFLDRGSTFGRSYVDFRSRYFYPAGFEFKPKSFATSDIRLRLEGSAFFCQKSDCLRLPPKQSHLIAVDLASKVRPIYDQLCTDWLTEFQGKQISVMQAVAKITRLAQITSGRFVADDGSVQILPCSKLTVAQALLDHLLQIHDKIVVWCRFVSEVEDIQALAVRLRSPAATVSGKSDISESLDLFKKNSTRLIILTLSKGSRALNLSAASAAVYYGRDFSVDRREQSRDRTYRIGSERHDSVQYYDICTRDTVEVSMLDTVQSAALLGGKIVDTRYLLKYLAGKSSLTNSVDGVESTTS